MDRTLTCDQLATLLASPALFAVFDVRERGEYNQCQIPGTTSLPRSQIELRIATLVPDPGTPIAVCDDGGTRAALAARTLEECGYADVARLSGGVPAWQREGRTVVSGVNVPSKAFGERVQHERGVPDISPQDLKRLLDSKADLVIFDVRTPEEYGRFCIPGGHNVPGGDLVLWADALKRKPDTQVIVNCAGRTRSIIGTAALQRLGVTNVLELRNGTMGWVLAGYDLENRPGRAGFSPPEDSRERAVDLAQQIAAEENVPWISPEALRQGLAGGRRPTYVFDVRAEPEYAAGHIAGSISLPGGQAVQRTDDFVAVRNGSIVLVSNRGARAVMAAYWYRQMGLPDVAVLEGGIDVWRSAGYPLSAGNAAAAPLGIERARQAARLLDPGNFKKSADTAGAVILDVGSSADYMSGHVPQAHWLSRGWLEATLPERLPDKTSRILLSCADGVQSVFAAQTLAQLGYGDVAVLDGGVQRWRSSGLGTEKGLVSCWSEPNDIVLSPSITGNRDDMRAYLDWEVKLTR